MRCPRCDEQVRDDVFYCPECGLAVDELRDRLAAGTCPRCEAEGTGAVDSCPECGLSLETLRNRVGVAGERGAHSPEAPDATSTGSDRPSGSPPGNAASTGGQNRQPGRADRQRQGHSGRRPRANAGLLSGISVPSAIGFGGAAYVANLVVTILLANVAVPGTYFENSPIGPLHTGGWFMYGAHQVPIAETTGPRTGQTVNVLEDVVTTGGAALSIPPPVFYLVPLVGLFLAGVATARWYATDPWQVTVATGAAVGGLLGVGYLALALLVGQTVFSISAFGATAAPAVDQTVLFMGAAYPVMAGGLGGVVGSL